MPAIGFKQATRDAREVLREELPGLVASPPASVPQPPPQPPELELQFPLAGQSPPGVPAALQPQPHQFYALLGEVTREYDLLRMRLSEAHADIAGLRSVLGRGGAPRREVARPARRAGPAAARGATPSAGAGAVAARPWRSSSLDRASALSAAASPSPPPAEPSRPPESPRPPPEVWDEAPPTDTESPRSPASPSRKSDVTRELAHKLSFQDTSETIAVDVAPGAGLRPFASQGSQDHEAERLSSASLQRLSLVSQCRAREESDDFELYPLWTQQVGRKRRPSQQTSTWAAVESSSSRISLADSTSGVLGEENSCWRRMILRPSCRMAVTWDCVTVLMLIWDLIMIPLAAYTLPDIPLWSIVEIIATLVWTTDILISFCKGFEQHGDVEMNPKAIARHYLKSWFVFDISIVGVDWALMVMQSGDFVDMLRFSRFRRAVRLLRLARLLKHGARFLQAVQYVQSEDWLAMLRIFWLLILLVAINHFISCGWYAIGGIKGMFEESWHQKAFNQDDDFAYRYLTSFHWSVSQFTPASMEVVPQNPLERAYNILIIFFGLLMFSSFVSNMTNSMTYLTQRNYEKRQQRDILSSYMNTRGLSLDLRSDITSALAAAIGSKKSRKVVVESDVTVLESLPENLLERMHVEVFLSVLQVHSLMSLLMDHELALVHRLCHQAMSEKVCWTGEEVFRVGLRCTRMHFSTSGSGRYMCCVEGSPAEVRVGKQWLCEPALWVKWEHRGNLIATSVLELALLDTDQFQSVAAMGMLLPRVQRYALLYVSYMQREIAPVTDLWGQRLRVMYLAQRAFKIEEAEEQSPAKGLLLMWSGTEFTTERIFQVWYTWSWKERRRRRPGLLDKLRLQWLVDRLAELFFGRAQASSSKDPPGRGQAGVA